MARRLDYEDADWLDDLADHIAVELRNGRQPKLNEGDAPTLKRIARLIKAHLGGT